MIVSHRAVMVCSSSFVIVRSQGTTGCWRSGSVMVHCDILPGAPELLQSKAGKIATVAATHLIASRRAILRGSCSLISNISLLQLVHQVFRTAPGQRHDAQGGIFVGIRWKR